MISVRYFYSSTIKLDKREYLQYRLLQKRAGSLYGVVWLK